ncbi:MAG: glycosyltransferase family 2 protein, partial [Candidatus Thermoplasmatota archaeon]|nr:glycosyltransferase family 2 protein [Candidatus Thermoplasmatota archaeon]
MTISICIPVISGTHLRECLDSISQSTFQEFEIIVNDSSGSPVVSDILKEYDVRTIERKSKSFESRYITTMASKGGKVFIFDETRLMDKTLLEDVNNRNNDMLFIKERDVGKGIVNYFSNLDKSSLPNDLSVLDPMRNKSVIPRVYRREIIVSALETVRKNLPENILSQVVGLDLELIYLESYGLTKDMGFISSSEIKHYGDESMR